MTAPLQRIFFACLGLLVAFEVCLRVTGWQATYAENNLQANLIRIAAYEFEPVPENLILGSSLSARLLPDFFSRSGKRFGNLSMDGAGVPMGLEMVAARNDKPALLLLEASSLFLRRPGNEQILKQAMANPVFGFGRHLWLFRPGSRPSSLLYAWLKKTRDTMEAGTPGAPPQSFTAQNHRIPSRELELLQELKQEGVNIVLVLVPDGQGESEPPPSWSVMANNLGVRWIRPRQYLPAHGEELRYTDGLHLDRSSAQKVCRAIEEELFKPKSR